MLCVMSSSLLCILFSQWTPANATSHDMKSADRGEHGGRGGDGVLQGAATIGTHVLSVFDAQEGSTSAATNRALAEYIVYEDDSSTTDTSDDSPLNSPPGSTRDSSPDSSPDSLALAEDEGRASWRGIHAMTVLRCAEAALHQGSSDMASKLLRRLQKLQEEGAVPSITFAAFPVLPSITALRNALVLPQVVSSMREHAALGAHIMAKLEDVQEAYFGGGQEIDVIDDLPLKVRDSLLRVDVCVCILCVFATSILALMWPALPLCPPSCAVKDRFVNELSHRNQPSQTMASYPYIYAPSARVCIKDHTRSG